MATKAPSSSNKPDEVEGPAQRRSPAHVLGDRTGRDAEGSKTVDRPEDRGETQHDEEEVNAVARYDNRLPQAPWRSRGRRLPRGWRRGLPF